jgi:tetratricopeptide (TPR) repeat protein/tRNA A-37 threonylcarbamoyl transferase component Bud32
VLAWLLVTATDTQAGDGPTLSATLDPERETGPDTASVGEAGPTRLGRYVLLARLGEGGMGVVYAAYDETLDRKVALKLLRSRGSETAQLRLIREAQALARLSHPNVVQIYEIGETSEQAYLVMEFVDGVTLGVWRLEQPRSRAEILAVFTAAGHGLAAAHAAGLVHRDFKPDNVMIRTDGRVLVMDFGLAFSDTGRIVGASDLRDLDLDVEISTATNRLSEHMTADGALMGTPAYMAPEQFLGLTTDAQTDQFGFCVALWEALYGQRPFGGRDVAAISLAVTEGQLLKPERDELPGWLREVIERGLAREPGKRWPSMQALLDALGRDPTRRRSIALLSLGFATALVATLVGVRVGTQRERDSAIAACEAEGRTIEADWNEDLALTLARAFAATKLEFADAAWQSTRRQLDDYANAWTELRTTVCIEARVEHTRDAASLEQVVACLDNQRAILAGLAQAWTDADRQTIVRATAAAAAILPPSTCADTALLARQVQPPKASRERVQALRIELEQAAALQLASRHEPALTRYRAVLAEAEALGWRPLIAEARFAIATAEVDTGHPEAAVNTLRAARVDALASGHDLVLLDAAIVSVEVIGTRLARYDEGSTWGELGLALIERLELEGTVYEADLRSSLGALNHAMGTFEQALEHDRRALSIRELQLGPVQPEVATSLDSIAVTLAATGNYDGALEHFERAKSIRATTLGPESLEVSYTLNGIGGVYMQLGELDRALATFQQAQAIVMTLLGPDHVELAPSHNNIGVILWQQGRLDDALVSFRRTQAIQEKVLGSEHPRVAAATDNIGNVLVSQGLYAEALVEHQRALAIREAALGPDHGDVASSLNNLATVLVALGNDEQALVNLQQAQAIWEPLFEPDHPYLMTALVNIADIYLRRGDHASALPLHERALAGYERSLGPDQLYAAYPLVGIARARLLRGELELARLAIDRALELRTRHTAPISEIAEARAVCAEVLWALGEHGQSLALARTARDGFRENGKASEADLHKLEVWLAARQ